MATPFGADNWSGILASTIAQYVRDAWINTTRRRKLLNMLRTNNRITFGHSGTHLEWPIEYNNQKMQGFGSGSVLTFSRQDRYKRATLGWRGYALGDALYEKDMLQNSGEAALVNLYSNIAGNLIKDMEKDLGTQFYIDGEASGNTLRYHGIETFAKAGSGAASTARPVVFPAGVTYAGLSTTLASEGGAWDTNGASAVIWPDGEGDVRYDYFTPLLVDYTSAVATSASANTYGFTGTANWKTRCEEALRYGVMNTRIGDTDEDMLTMGMLSSDLYRDFINNQTAKERIVTVRTDGPSGLGGSGFAGDSFNFEGVDFTWETAVPSGVGYGFNAMQMQLCSLLPSLMKSDGPFRDMSTMAYQFSVAMFGNCLYRPRRFVKWLAFT